MQGNKQQTVGGQSIGGFTTLNVPVSSLRAVTWSVDKPVSGLVSNRSMRLRCAGDKIIWNVDVVVLADDGYRGSVLVEFRFSLVARDEWREG